MMSGPSAELDSGSSIASGPLDSRLNSYQDPYPQGSTLLPDNLSITEQLLAANGSNLDDSLTNKDMSSVLPWDRFSSWIHCICIVTFDLEVGQAIEVSSFVDILLIFIHFIGCSVLRANENMRH